MRPRFLFVIGVSVIVMVVLAAYFVDLRSQRVSGSIRLVGTVQSVLYEFDGSTACWSNGTAPGFGWTQGGGLIELSYLLKYATPVGGPSSCSVDSAQAGTPGFELLHSDAPFTVDSGSSGYLNTSVETPTGSWAGNLTILVNVSAG